MSRYCPNCGAVVPDNSLNCPQCFTDVPRDGGITEQEHIREHQTREQYYDRMEKRHKSRTAIMALAVIPAFFGLLGLAQIYRDRRDRLGWMFLVGGLILYGILALLAYLTITTGLLGVLIFIPLVLLALVYILAALTAIFDALTGVLGLLSKFR